MPPIGFAFQWKSGRTSAPRLQQAVQTSRSDNRIIRPIMPLIVM
jgi:hypothetical protein